MSGAQFAIKTDFFHTANKLWSKDKAEGFPIETLEFQNVFFYVAVQLFFFYVFYVVCVCVHVRFHVSLPIHELSQK